jgi:hypothetical protein
LITALLEGELQPPAQMPTRSLRLDVRLANGATVVGILLVQKKTPKSAPHIPTGYSPELGAADRGRMVAGSDTGPGAGSVIGTEIRREKPFLDEYRPRFRLILADACRAEAGWLRRCVGRLGLTQRAGMMAGLW